MSSPIATEFLAGGAVRVTVSTLGRRARRAAEAGEAEVIARFERSVYVRAANGQFACIGGESLGLGPLNALTANAEFDPAGLALGARVSLDAGGAVLWRPRGFAVPAAGIAPALTALAAALAAVPPRGLASPPDGDPATVRARKGLAALAAWVAAGGGALADDVAGLIGLGPGLTPAGDDALGGAMIALRSFGQSGLADQLAAGLLPLATARTSAISAAHLQAAADGEGAAALHDTLAALAAGDAAAATEALRRLDRIGHSSGWDALAGAAVALCGLV